MPTGTLNAFTLEPGAVYPGVPHQCELYVPAQYRPDVPAPVMIFLDGTFIFVDRMHVPPILDDLIARGDIPPLIGVFVDPGVLPVRDAETQQARFNRHFEYDAINGRFASFVLDELLPFVERSHTLSHDANDRAIAGISTGAVGAFMAAWERPDQFRRVFGGIGTFVDILGANVLPHWIRKTEPKPIRVFLEETTNDQNGLFGSWPIANEAMRSALEFAHYDHTLVIGEGEHAVEHAAEILPEALRWLWRDYPAPISAPTTGPIFETLLYPGEGWEQLSAEHLETTSPVADADGHVYFADPAASRIFRAVDTNVSLFAEHTDRARALTVGPDGRLYAVQPKQRRVVVYSMDGTVRTVANDVDARDLAVTSAGVLYATDPVHRTVMAFDAGRRFVAYDGGHLAAPSALALSPDQAFLHTLDADSKFGWSFQITPDGTLINGEPLFRMEWSEEPDLRAVERVCVDTTGELYTPTAIGIALSSQTGRSRELINKPESGSVRSVGFGGPGHDWLYATQNGKLFRRHIRRTGATPWRLMKPPVPRL